MTVHCIKLIKRIPPNLTLQVTKTVCTETDEISDNEVCAYSFTLTPVETEAKLVDVKWEKSCGDATICVNPHHAPGGYAAPTECVEEYRHVCHLSPVLYPVIKKVTITTFSWSILTITYRWLSSYPSR